MFDDLAKGPIKQRMIAFWIASYPYRAILLDRTMVLLATIVNRLHFVKIITLHKAELKTAETLFMNL